MNAEDLLNGIRVVPVVVVDAVADAIPLAETLLANDIRAIEVTLRTPEAVAVIREMAANVAGMIVGAGSVRKASQFAEVQAAGAQFAVSPGSSPELLAAAAETGLPFIPGAITPSESLNLLDHGYRLQKFFPAELAGGVKFLAALGAPIPEVRFMPTGGIKPENAPEYLALENVACLGGTWIAPRELVGNGDFDGIGRLAAEAAKL